MEAVAPVPVTRPRLPLQLRPTVPDDVPLILSSWLRGYRQDGYGVGRIDHDAFFAHQRPICERLLSRATVTVATPTDSTATVLGYAVHEPGVLHWVWVKPDFRGFGVASRLLLELDNVRTFTHLTIGAGTEAVLKRLAGARYIPYAAWPR